MALDVARDGRDVRRGVLRVDASAPVQHVASSDQHPKRDQGHRGHRNGVVPQGPHRNDVPRRRSVGDCILRQRFGFGRLIFFGFSHERQSTGASRIAGGFGKLGRLDGTYVHLFLRAFEAGNDLLLFSQSTPLVERAFKTIVRAARGSTVLGRRLDESTERILRLKHSIEFIPLRYRSHLKARITRQIEKLRTSLVETAARDVTV